MVRFQAGGETITCTTEHPFYVQGKGWVAAQDLKPNDKLELRDGEDAFVDAVRYEKLDKPIPVFNFEVEGFHTYFVGVGCILVHNLCKQQTVAKEGKYSAKVSVGGENNRHVPHAHIFNKYEKIASVDKNGSLLTGSLDRKARVFIKNHLDEISAGIEKYYTLK